MVFLLLLQSNKVTSLAQLSGQGTNKKRLPLKNGQPLMMSSNLKKLVLPKIRNSKSERFLTKLD